MLIAAKSPALTHSAALTPHATMTRPPIAGPIAKHSEKETLSSVLPASSVACRLQRRGHSGAGQRPADEGEGPVRGGQNEHEDQQGRRGHQRQRREDRGLGDVEGRQYAPNAETVELRRGGGTDESGINSVQIQRPVIASALWVRSKTTRPSATVPNPQPSSLSVQEVADRAEGGVAKRAERDHAGWLSDRCPADTLTRWLRAV